MENYTVGSFRKLYLRVFDVLTFILQRPQFCQKKLYSMGFKNRIIFNTLGSGVKLNNLILVIFYWKPPPPPPLGDTTYNDSKCEMDSFS